MIKKLQVKFVVIIMSIMTAVLLAVFGAINYTMYQSTTRQSQFEIQKLADSDGLMKSGARPNFKDNMDKTVLPSFPTMPQANFSVKLSDDGTISDIISDRNHDYTQEEIAEYLAYALQNGDNTGKAGNFNYLISKKDYGQIVVFLDNSMQENSATRLFWITVIVGLSSWLLIFFIAIFLSKWAIKPVQKAYEAQKRFVADASHELKTPLTVISANIDVLTPDFEGNKWLQFIKAETIRMSELVNNLLYLAKSDASEHAYIMHEFNLSEAVTNAVLPFESSCYEANKHLSLEIRDDVLYKGDERRIMQVVIILMDNAIKNASESGNIKVSLSIVNGKRCITVYNDGIPLPDEVKTKLFDRFYRGDSSRDRNNGGYGLGLSIAKTIVDAHKGRIVVENVQDTGVGFSVQL